VKAGAQVSNIFTVAKLVPLFGFAAMGLFFLRRGPVPATVSPDTGAWLEAVLVLVFAYGGFEAALLPLGEAKNPRRDAPFALCMALIIVTILYVSVQVVVLGVLPSHELTDRPLAAAARVFMGEAGAGLIALGALISVYGYLSSQMLNAPRLIYALAEQGDFPALFAKVHQRFRTPHVSILTFAMLTLLMAAYGTFRWNLTLSAVARLLTYASTCGALMVFRKKQPEAAAFRLPGGPVLALIGIGFCVVVAGRMGRGELQILAATLVLGFLTWLWSRRRSVS
jgi:amino acid transporter